MPDLSQLNLNEEATPQVDWDAPEPGSFPPVVRPGTYELRFRMPESQSDWFDAQEIETVKGDPNSKRKFLQINYNPEVVADVKGNAIPPLEGSDKQPVLMFQRANFYRSEKMVKANMNSSGGDLLRGLGLRLTAVNPEAVRDALASVDGRVQFKAEVGWRCYFKSSDLTVSTFPSKSRGEVAWPKNAQGDFLDMAVNPKTGEKGYGQAQIIRVKLPTSK